MIDNFDAIIFDMDGLLVDSETVWYDAEDAFIQSFGYEYSEDVREAIIGLRMDEFIEKLKDHYGLPGSVAELVADLNERVFSLIATDDKAQPGAVELIDYVVSSGIPYAIASSSPMEVIHATLDSQRWTEHFTIRCSADDDAKGKPAPDVYLRTAEILGVRPERCLALEDSPNGARAAVAAGMTCYAVPDPSHSKPEAFAEITPHVYPSLHAVLEHLKA
jgi:HAD superfamily hydrolase (TIGR01509 family)